MFRVASQTRTWFGHHRVGYVPLPGSRTFLSATRSTRASTKIRNGIPLRIASPPRWAPLVGYLVSCSSGILYPAVWCDDHAISGHGSKHHAPIAPIHRHGTPRRRSWRRRLARVWRILKRVLQLSVTLAPVVLLYPIALWFHAAQAANDDPDNANGGGVLAKDARQIVLTDKKPASGWLGWYLQMCLTCVEWSGAAVIKLMQWAGSRPDLFGHEFCVVFSQLQDHTTPHRWAHTEAKLQEAFGKDWQNKIRLGDVIGSGCIGQVYHGQVLSTDNDGGGALGQMRDVAVKVLHPNVQSDIEADLDLMRLAVRAVKYVPFDVFANLKWLNMEGVVDEFAHLLQLQLDLRQEAANLERFNANFKDVPQVEFPKLVEGYVPTKNVLVESFCVGVPVLKFARENQHNHNLMRAICQTGIRAVCKMIFLDNFMHGDLHPGNVYISQDGKKFILFDVGIVAEYSEEDHRAIVDVLAAFIRKKGRVAGRRMIADSNNRLRGSGDYAREEERYIDKIEELTIKASGKDYFMEHLGTYISYICDAAAAHHVMMNPSFISAALAVKVQEGIALALDPSINLPKVAIPVIIEAERRRDGLIKSACKVLGVDEWISSHFGTKQKTNCQSQ